MGRRTAPANRLTIEEIMNGEKPESSDGGGLYLRYAESTKEKRMGSWVFRYTSPTTKKRREKGLGFAVVTGSLIDAQNSLKEVREKAQQCRDMIAEGLDPLDSEPQKQKPAWMQPRTKQTEEDRKADVYAMSVNILQRLQPVLLNLIYDELYNGMKDAP